MEYTDKIDKEAGLIRLTVGQICSVGIAHNVITGDRKMYATPFMHTVWDNGKPKDIGLAIRICNDGTIVGNPSYTGNALIAFIANGTKDMEIHTAKITRINKRSVCVEPIDFQKKQ